MWFDAALALALSLSHLPLSTSAALAPAGDHALQFGPPPPSALLPSLLARSAAYSIEM